MGVGTPWEKFKTENRALSKEAFCEQNANPFLIVSFGEPMPSGESQDPSDQRSKTIADGAYIPSMTISDAEEETESENERLVYVAGFKNKASRTLQIGRAPESDLVVSFKGMSKRHAFMMKTFRSETFLIMDNHSMNGTKVNGEALEEGEKRPLEFGDQISFGSKIIAKFHSAESLYGLLQE